jgi:hypothetical protein
MVQIFLFLGIIKIKNLESYDQKKQNKKPTDKKTKRIKLGFLGLFG